MVKEHVAGIVGASVVGEMLEGESVVGKSVVGDVVVPAYVHTRIPTLTRTRKPSAGARTHM